MFGGAAAAAKEVPQVSQAYQSLDRRKGKQRRRWTRPPLRFVVLWAAFTFLLSMRYLLRHDILDQPVTPDLIGSTSRENGTVPASSMAYDAQAHAALGNVPFPMHVYAPLLPNAAPITDIAVETCFPLALTLCKPPTTRELDAELGVWVHVPRPLDAEVAATLGSESRALGRVARRFRNLESKYLFYRRSSRAGVRRVVDVQVVRDGEELVYRAGDWHLVPNSLTSSSSGFFRKKSKSSYLRFHTVSSSAGADGSAAGVGKAGVLEQDAITELDVVYGENPPWPSFELAGQVSPATAKHVSVSLAVRRKPEPAPSMSVAPLFKPDGTFKIIQIADLHYSVETKPCREVARWMRKTCTTNSTQEMLERWLDLEQPDMVVFSGDQLNGQDSSWDERSVITQFLRTIIARKIPWAAIHGNHDSQSGVLTRREQSILLSHMPYSLTRAGPPSLHAGTGAGNYYVHLRSPTPDATHLFSLYFLDSGADAPRIRSWLPWKWSGWNGYDWVRPDQVQWFLEKSRAAKKHVVPYVPQGRDMTSGSKGVAVRKPPALLWCHIPLPEAYDKVDRDEQGVKVKFGAKRMEGGGHKGGQRYRGLVDAIKSQGDDRDVLGVLSGHNHGNADCRRVSGIWHCLNGGSSFEGYGKLGFERRARIIMLERWGERVSTWHRYEKGLRRIDEATIFEA